MPKQNVPTINPDIVPEDADLDSIELTDADKLWLQNMGRLPEGEDEQPVFFHHPDGSTISNDPAWHLANSPGMSDRIQAMVEARAQELAKEMVLQEAQSAHAVAGEYYGNAVGEPGTTGTQVVMVEDENGGFDDWEDTEYAGKSNDDLRNELDRRELSTVGRKEQLVKRLMADDQGVEEEGDEDVEASEGEPPPDLDE